MLHFRYIGCYNLLHYGRADYGLRTTDYGLWDYGTMDRGNPQQLNASDGMGNRPRPPKTVWRIRILPIGQNRTRIFNREPRQIRETNGQKPTLSFTTIRLDLERFIGVLGKGETRIFTKHHELPEKKVWP